MCLQQAEKQKSETLNLAIHIHEKYYIMFNLSVDQHNFTGASLDTRRR